MDVRKCCWRAGVAGKYETFEHLRSDVENAKAHFDATSQLLKKKKLLLIVCARTLGTSCRGVVAKNGRLLKFLFTHTNTYALFSLLAQPYLLKYKYIKYRNIMSSYMFSCIKEMNKYCKKLVSCRKFLQSFSRFKKCLLLFSI